MTPRLSAFIAGSCLLHAGLLWQARQADVPLPDIGGEASALSVTLVAAAAPAAASTDDRLPAAVRPTVSPSSHPVVTAQTPAQQAPTRARVQRAAAPARQPATASATPAHAPQKITANADAGAPSSALNVSERVSAALQRQLAEAFEYPWLARKRGWQGMVTLSLHIAEDGSLSHWQVVSTSGYRLLDRSALQAAQRIGRLQQAEQLLQGRSLNLSIPIRYQLLDG